MIHPLAVPCVTPPSAPAAEGIAFTRTPERPSADHVLGEGEVPRPRSPTCTRRTARGSRVASRRAPASVPPTMRSRIRGCGRPSATRTAWTSGATAAGPGVADGRPTSAVENRHVGRDGKEVCRGVDRSAVVAVVADDAPPGTPLLRSTTLRRADGPLVFGPQHETGPGFRVATPLTVDGGGRTGRTVGSHGGADGAGDRGRVGTWRDHAGTAEGRRAGVLAVAAADSPRGRTHATTASRHRTPRVRRTRRTATCRRRRPPFRPVSPCGRGPACCRVRRRPASRPIPRRPPARCRTGSRLGNRRRPSPRPCGRCRRSSARACTGTWPKAAATAGAPCGSARPAGAGGTTRGRRGSTRPTGRAAAVWSTCGRTRSTTSRSHWPTARSRRRPGGRGATGRRSRRP